MQKEGSALNNLAKTHKSPWSDLEFCCSEFGFLLFKLKAWPKVHYPYDKNCKNRCETALVQCCNLPLF